MSFLDSLFEVFRRRGEHGRQWSDDHDYRYGDHNDRRNDHDYSSDHDYRRNNHRDHNGHRYRRDGHDD